MSKLEINVVPHHKCLPQTITEIKQIPETFKNVMIVQLWFFLTYLLPIDQNNVQYLCIALLMFAKKSYFLECAQSIHNQVIH